MIKKPKLGRPRLPVSERKKYQRTAMYPETHSVAKDLATKYGMNLIDWLDQLVLEEKARKRKAFTESND